MSDEWFLRADGGVEWRPDAAMRAKIRSSGGYVIGRGALCTACLVGTWPVTLYRAAQTLCDACRGLDAEVTRRAGADPVTAGRFTAGVIEPGRRDATEWAEVDRARAYRAAHLDEVFGRARTDGIVRLEEDRGTEPPVERIAGDDLDRVVPRRSEDRVARYARWLEALDPDGYARRAHVLADVDVLARWLEASEQRSSEARARIRLEDAERAAQRAQHALADAREGLEAVVGRAGHTEGRTT